MAAPHSVIRDADTIDTPIIDSNNRPNRAIDTQSNAQPDFQPRARDDINTNPNPNPNPNSLTRLSLIAMGAIVLETLCSPMLFQ